MPTKPPGTSLELRSSLSNHVDTRTLSNQSYVDILRFALTEAVRDDIMSQCAFKRLVTRIKHNQSEEQFDSAVKQSNSRVNWPLH